MKLKDKIAIVTGAGQGLGKAIAIGLAGEGATVLAADIFEETARETVTAIEERGGTASAFPVDISRSYQVQQMVAAAVERYGKIDILVNNAAINTMANSQMITEEVWDQTIAVNLTGTFLCCKYAIAEMQKTGGGTIINIASVQGLEGFANSLAYSASKGGVMNLTKCLAIDHARDNIRVNAICPADIETPMLTNLVEQEGMEPMKKYMLRKHAMRRFGKPGEIASVAVFLASDDSSYITGESITVDGGWMCGTSVDIAEVFSDG